MKLLVVISGVLSNDPNYLAKAEPNHAFENGCSPASLRSSARACHGGRPAADEQPVGYTVAVTCAGVLP